LGLRDGNPDTEGDEYCFASEGLGSGISIARILEVEQAMIWGAFPVYIPIDEETMLADGNTSDMSAGAMLCKNTLDLDDRKVFVVRDNRQLVLENARDMLGVFDAIDVPACTVGLIVYEITAVSRQGKCLLGGRQYRRCRNEILVIVQTLGSTSESP